MNNIGQYLMHILTFFGSLWLFSMAFGFYKIPGDNFFNDYLVKWKIFIRIIAIFGVLKTGYELYDLSSNKSWSQNEKDLFTQELVIGFSKKMSGSKQDLTDFCDCIVGKISQTIPYDDFIKTATIPESDAYKLYKFQIDSCYQKYSYKLTNESDR